MVNELIGVEGPTIVVQERPCDQSGGCVSASPSQAGVDHAKDDLPRAKRDRLWKRTLRAPHRSFAHVQLDNQDCSPKHRLNKHGRRSLIKKLSRYEPLLFSPRYPASTRQRWWTVHLKQVVCGARKERMTRRVQ